MLEKAVATTEKPPALGVGEPILLDSRVGGTNGVGCHAACGAPDDPGWETGGLEVTGSVL